MNVKIFDLENCVESYKNGLYGGAAGSKDGILINGEMWMVKYPKSTKSMNNVETSYTTTPLCEYLGSHVFQTLGYETHETILGIRHGKLVVGCKDFTDDNTELAEIRTIKNHSNEILSEKLGIDMDSTGDAHSVNLADLMIHIRNNPILTSVPNLEEHFFEQAVVDVYLNNNDRNNGNWGLLRHKKGGPDVLAPIFDNGGSFQNKISNAKAAIVLQDIASARKNACNTQTAYATADGKIYSARHFLALRKEYPKLNDAVLKVTGLIEEHQKDIEDIIDSLPSEAMDQQGNIYEVCGPQIKELFRLQLNARLEMLLLPEREKIIEETRNNREITAI